MVHSLNVHLLVQVAQGKLDISFFAPPYLLEPKLPAQGKPIPGPRSPPRHEPSCCGGASFHHRPWHCGLRLCQATFACGTTASAFAGRPSLVALRPPFWFDGGRRYCQLSLHNITSTIQLSLVLTCTNLRYSRIRAPTSTKFKARPPAFNCFWAKYLPTYHWL